MFHVFKINGERDITAWGIVWWLAKKTAIGIVSLVLLMTVLSFLVKFMIAWLDNLFKSNSKKSVKMPSKLTAADANSVEAGMFGFVMLGLIIRHFAEKSIYFQVSFFLVTMVIVALCPGRALSFLGFAVGGCIALSILFLIFPEVESMMYDDLKNKPIEKIYF